MQLTFLPEIDRDATKKKVEDILEEYQIMLLMDPEEFEPKVTAAFKLVVVAPGNEFHSSTEETAIKRIDMDIRKQKHITKVQKAVNRLSYHERSIIIKRYLNSDDVFDYEVYNELGFSETKYYRIKSDAFYKLAFILKLAVYKEDEENECCTAH